jgi:hypothetical protein
VECGDAQSKHSGFKAARVLDIVRGKGLISPGGKRRTWLSPDPPIGCVGRREGALAGSGMTG